MHFFRKIFRSEFLNVCLFLSYYLVSTVISKYNIITQDLPGGDSKSILLRHIKLFPFLAPTVAAHLPDEVEQTINNARDSITFKVPPRHHPHNK